MLPYRLHTCTCGRRRGFCASVTTLHTSIACPSALTAAYFPLCAAPYRLRLPRYSDMSRLTPCGTRKPSVRRWPVLSIRCQVKLIAPSPSLGMPNINISNYNLGLPYLPISGFTAIGDSNSPSNCDKPSDCIPLEDPNEATKKSESDAGNAVRRVGPKRRSEPGRNAGGSEPGTRNSDRRAAVQGGRQSRTRKGRRP